MDSADPELQKAIYESLRAKPGLFVPSGSGAAPTLHRQSSSEIRFGRVDSLRRSGISPAASRCAHTPLTSIRLRRSRSLSKQGSGISDRSDISSLLLEDSGMKNFIESEVLLRSAANATTFDDIAGLEHAKKLLTEAITLPLLMPDFFVGIRAPWRGVLLFGPPGSGKTILAKALAGTREINFFNCPGSTLTSKYRGDSEKLVKTVFSVAREKMPSILFFDEADALISKRGTADEHEASRRFKSEMLQQMDGVTSDSEHLMVLATSNCPWDIDEAILRRFEKRIYIPLPDTAARKAALQLHLQGVQCAEDVDVDALAARLEGYSGADIRLICKDASMMFIRKWLENRSPREILKLRESCPSDAAVTMDDFIKALEKSAPTVKRPERYEAWARDYACL